MIECDQKKIRLLILSIDIKKRKYVQIRLENSDSFNFRSEISNLNENNALGDRISKERDSVRILSIWSLLQDTKLNLIRKELASNSHKKSFCTVEFLFLFLSQYSLVISTS
jgi:hypothetical protein